MKFIFSNLKKKTIYLCFFFILIFFLSISYNFFSSPYCKTHRIVFSVKDFGTNHVYDCFSYYEMKRSIKSILKPYPLLYNFIASLRDKNIRDFSLNKPPNQNDLLDLSVKNEKPKKVIGLVNRELVSKTKYKFFDKKNFDQWSRSHGDNSNSKFLDNDQINLQNIKNLKLFWNYSTISNEFKVDIKSNYSTSLINEKKLKRKWKQNIEVNPIFLNGKLVFVSADWKIICIDIEKKKVLWELNSIFPPSRRGILAYTKNNSDYLILPIGNKIYKLDLNTGKRVKTFGNNGSINLSTITSPIVDIEKNNLIITNHTNKAVFKINLTSGEIISVIPLFNPKKRNFVGGTPWAGTAYDDKNKIIFIPTGNPQPGLYGVKRPGINERSSSIIAVDLNKDKIIWTFQDVFHDLWDYDLAFPPILDDIEIDSKKYSIVVVVSKTGNAIILDRFSGLPLFDIEFVSVEKSIVEGEDSFDYQRKYILPERLSEIEYKDNDYSKLSEEKQKEIKLKLNNSRIGYFPPPSFDKDTIIFGLHGGGEWYGGSLDPFEDSIYVPVNNYPWKIKPYFYSTEIKTDFNENEKKIMNVYLNKCSSCHGKNRNGINTKKGELQLEYIPSLVGLTTLKHLEKNLNYENVIKKHKELEINTSDFESIKSLFVSWDKKLIKNNKMRVRSNGLAWSEFTTSDGNPASNPPWGYVVKLDLKTGKILWKTPVGYELTMDKNKPTGTSIFGGTALNSGGVLFVTGTHDNLVYGINAKTGKIIWEYKMYAAGSAPPTLFNYKNEQYLVVVSTGGAYYRYKNKDSSIYIFKISS